jgi:hypothetical protein
MAMWSCSVNDLIAQWIALRATGGLWDAIPLQRDHDLSPRIAQILSADKVAARCRRNDDDRCNGVLACGR